MDQRSNTPSSRRSRGSSAPPFTRPTTPLPVAAPQRGTRPFFMPPGVAARGIVQPASDTGQSEQQRSEATPSGEQAIAQAEPDFAASDTTAERERNEQPSASEFDVSDLLTPRSAVHPHAEQHVDEYSIPAIGDAEPTSLDELFAALGEASSHQAEKSEAPVVESEATTVDFPASEPSESSEASPADFRSSDLPAMNAGASAGQYPPSDLPAMDSESAAGYASSVLPAAAPPDGPADSTSTPSPPRFSPSGSQMVVDFNEVVGGTREASFDTEGLSPQSLGPDVFESLAPWGVPAGDSHPSEDGGEPDANRGPVGFPTPSIFLETIAAHDDADRGFRADEVEPGQGTDAESREVVPIASALHQIVQQHVAAGGNGDAIAAALERVADRVRRGEIRVPNVSADGEAAALALALTALLQPRRD